MRIMDDLKEYKQLIEDEKKIEKKMAGEITPKELKKIYFELRTIIKRKTEIRYILSPSHVP